MTIDVMDKHIPQHESGAKLDHDQIELQLAGVIAGCYYGSLRGHGLRSDQILPRMIFNCA